MKYLSFLLYTIIFIVIVTPVAVVIFDFYDISFEVYGNYLFWFIAMALFNALLPMEKKSIFDIEEVAEKVTSASKAASTSVTALKSKLSITTPVLLSKTTTSSPNQTITNTTFGKLPPK